MSQYERSPSRAQVLDALRESAKRQIRVAIPASVQSYDPATQTVDVQPLVNDFAQQEDGTVADAPFAVVPHVPVAFPGGGGFRVTFPLRQGDTGQLIVNDLSIDRWQALGGQGGAGNQRRHHIADAVFYPGIHPDNASWTGASASGATLGADGGPQAVFRTAQIELGGTDLNPPTDAVALASLVLAQLNAFKMAVSGWVVVPNDGGAALKAILTTLFTTWPASVASAIVKAK